MQAGGKSIAVLDEVTSSSLGSHSSDRLKISYKDNHVVAIVNVAANFPHESIGLYEETWKKLRMEAEEDVEVQLAMLPESLHYIQAKIRNERLRETEIDSIIEDVVERHLSDIELSSFLTALYIHGLSMDEIEALTKAMELEARCHSARSQYWISTA
jgi:AMP phosphorylase